jgi:small subunit ribosomal protein S9
MAKTEETNVKAGASAEAASQPSTRGPDKSGFYWGTGRRKTSVARVRLKPGEGKLLINKRRLEEYFKTDRDRAAVVAPLAAAKGEKPFDVYVNVRGGGTTGQAGATVLGIARALREYDPGLTQMLREGRYLTRDPRMVERKKAGQAGARKRFQFSKR